MKATALITSLLLAILFSNIALAQELPSQGFNLELGEKNIYLLPGETKKLPVKIVRSKSHQKRSIALKVGSRLPEGMQVGFEKGLDPKNEQFVIISASPTIEPFQKTIILKGESTRFTKGTMLSIVVGDEATLSAN